MVHARLARGVAGYAVAAIAASLVSLHWPNMGTFLAAATAAAGLVDAAGGRSWVRWLTPRRGHRNVWAWASDCAPDPSPGPWPGVPSSHDARPQGLIVVAAHPRRRLATHSPAIGALFGFLALAGILITMPLHTQEALAVRAGTSVVLLFVAAAAAAIDRRRGPPRATAGIAMARELLPHLADAVDRRLGVVVVGGLEPWFDGLGVALLSRRRRIPPDRTVVLVWHPTPGPLAIVPLDGPFRSAAPAHFLHAARALVLPDAPRRPGRPWRTAALRARRMGWPAMGLVGGANDPHAAEGVAQLLKRLTDPPSSRGAA